MTSLSRLISAAALVTATALTPGLAAAGDHREGREREDRREWRGRDDDRRDDRREDRRDERWEARDEHSSAPPAWSRGGERHAAPPAWTWRDDLRWDGRGWVRAGWERREMGERYERARAVRLELAALERDRAAFELRLGWNPRGLALADARFSARCAELERELQWLTWYASR